MRIPKNTKETHIGYGLNEFLLSLYVAFAVSAELIGQFAQRLGNGRVGLVWLALFLLFFTLSSIIAAPVLRKLAEYRLKRDRNELTGKKRLLFAFGFFMVGFAAMAVWYWIYYPGWFSGDSEWQLRQALSGEYNDWHPVLQTLITFTIPLNLTRGWKGSVILFQILEYALVLSYLCMTFMKYGNRRYALAAFAWIAFSPLTGAIVKQPWKDVTFAIFSLLLAAYAIHIFYDAGWIRKPQNILVLTLTFTISTIVRHNAVLFALPMLLAILLSIDKRKWKIILLSSCLLLVVLVKGPLYSMLQVEKPGSRSVETLGLPMTVIGAVVTEDPSALDEETLAFAYSVASPECWEENYSVGDFNSVKFVDACNTQPINEAGPLKVLAYMGRCLKASPACALEALLRLTGMVYVVSGPIDWKPDFFPPLIYSFLENSLFRYLCLYIGIPSLICIAITLGKCRLGAGEDWKKLWFCFALLLHNWGTMLLLTGPDFRFFYITFPMSAVIVFLMLNDGV